MTSEEFEIKHLEGVSYYSNISINYNSEFMTFIVTNPFTLLCYKACDQHMGKTIKMIRQILKENEE